jgi:hypothetical protein
VNVWLVLDMLLSGWLGGSWTFEVNVHVTRDRLGVRCCLYLAAPLLNGYCTCIVQSVENRVVNLTNLLYSVPYCVRQ